MFDPTSRLFPGRKDLVKDVPFVLRVNFGEILGESATSVAEPIVCGRCGGFMAGTEQLREDDNLGLVYDCVFCGTTNQITAKEPAAYEIMEVSKITTLEADEEEVSNEPTGRPWIACIDTSGSMQGAPMQAVKQSLKTTLDSLAAAQRGIKFGLVEFGDVVRVHNFSNSNVVEIDPRTYDNFQSILDEGKRTVSVEWMIDLEKDLETSKQYVDRLHAAGGTPLGPAMTAALAFATASNAERVILLTDGEANVGIGSVTGPSAIGSAIYNMMAKAYRRVGTSIDMVGVVSGAHLHLRTIGVLSQLTRGSMYYVGTDEIEESIGEIAKKQRVASDVVARLVGSQSVRLSDASGATLTEIEDLKERNQATIGNVGIDDEIYLSLEPSDVVGDEVALQLQVSYVDQDGERRSRILTKRLPVTEDLKEFANAMDPTLPCTFAVQKSALGDVIESEQGIEAVDGNEILYSIARSLSKLASVADEPSLFQKCREKLGYFMHVIAEKRIAWADRGVRHFAAPIYHYAQKDYDYVDAMNRAKMTRAELFAE